MEDGYFATHGRAQTVLLCTECFTKPECLLLIDAPNIKATLKVRDVGKGKYRVRISKTSMPLVRQLVMPYMHPSFMYKLGVK